MNLNIILIIILFLLYNFVYTSSKSIKEMFSCIDTIQIIANSKNDTQIPSTLNNYFSKIDYKTFKTTDIKPDGKIFLSIASYRDPQCPLTVLDAISKASNPEKLVIVI